VPPTDLPEVEEDLPPLGWAGGAALGAGTGVSKPSASRRSPEPLRCTFVLGTGDRIRRSFFTFGIALAGGIASVEIAICSAFAADWDDEELATLPRGWAGPASGEVELLIHLLAKL
jgi:hypothetical protein